MERSHSLDPVVPDWSSLELENTWADDIKFSSLSGIATFIRSVFGQRQRVQINAQQDMLACVPKYALQEFHNVPNGNYSKQISRGYITGFDRSMLGTIAATRRQMAQHLKGRDSALDVGTAGGKLAAELYHAGVKDVWAADISPYLLKHAASDHPNVKFIQAKAESLPFSDERFDGITVCFLFHEMPPKYIKQAVAGFYRMLQPGGKLLIAEPSPKQLDKVSLASLSTMHGWKHLYFRTLANFVHEPFLDSWHKLDKHALLEQQGLSLVEFHDEIPIALYVYEKPAA